MAILVLPAGSYSGSILQKEKIKRHLTKHTNTTTNNENKETIATMAQPAATFGMPWIAVAQTIALCIVPTKLDPKEYPDIYSKKT
jgi:hypothetical protein